jgi:hypothetical protein
MAQELECLPIELKALNSNPNTTKKKRRRIYSAGYGGTYITYI